MKRSTSRIGQNQNSLGLNENPKAVQDYSKMAELLTSVVDECTKKNDEVVARLKKFEDKIKFINQEDIEKQNSINEHKKRSTNRIAFPEDDDPVEGCHESQTQYFFRNLVADSKKSEVIDLNCREFPQRGSDSNFTLKNTTESLRRLEDPKYKLPAIFKFTNQVIVQPKSQPSASNKAQDEEKKIDPLPPVVVEPDSPEQKLTEEKALEVEEVKDSIQSSVTNFTSDSAHDDISLGVPPETLKKVFDRRNTMNMMGKR